MADTDDKNQLIDSNALPQLDTGGKKNGILTSDDKNSSLQSEKNLDSILDIPLNLSVELGRTKMLINELLKLSQGSIVELSKASGETLDVYANSRLIAKGEVVAVNDNYGVRLTEIISPSERVKSLK